jgi:hypothetical protein
MSFSWTWLLKFYYGEEQNFYLYDSTAENYLYGWVTFFKFVTISTELTTAVVKP